MLPVSHMRLVSAPGPDPSLGTCRIEGCATAGVDGLGFCGACRVAYDFTRARAHARCLLAAALVRVTHPALFEALSASDPNLAESLAMHLAAYTTAGSLDPDALSLDGLEDFLAELAQNGRTR